MLHGSISYPFVKPRIVKLCLHKNVNGVKDVWVHREMADAFTSQWFYNVDDTRGNSLLYD